jgi:hypothetical protein
MRLTSELTEAELHVHGDIVAVTITSRREPSRRWEGEVLLPAVVREDRSEHAYQPDGTLKVKLRRFLRAKA